MSRTAYVNGRYVPHLSASVHVEDRGYQFADGIYEVIAVRDGRLVDEGPHLDRLERSLRELALAPAMGREPLRAVVREVVRRNRVRNGIVYIQMTRGVAPRDHAYPRDVPTSIVVTARNQAPKAALRGAGVTVVTTPDIRWKRCDIKTISLLPNVMAKQRAVEAGAYEAWMIDERGHVTEGTATNAWIVSGDRTLITHAPDAAILDGVTRRTVQQLAEQDGYRLELRNFALEEARSATEAFLTSTTSWVMPVVSIDGVPVGDGRPGPLTRLLQDRYSHYLDAT